MEQVVQTSTATSASALRRAFDKLFLEGERLVHDIDVWISRLNDGEKVLGLCLFILLLFFLILRKPNSHKNSGGAGRQFAFALVIVIIASFGAGWLFEGRFEIPEIF